jgi:hypothetical protein
MILFSADHELFNSGCLCKGVPISESFTRTNMIAIERDTKKFIRAITPNTPPTESES